MWSLGVWRGGGVGGGRGPQTQGRDDPAQRVHRHCRLHHRQRHLCVPDRGPPVHRQRQHVHRGVDNMWTLHHDW